MVRVSIHTYCRMSIVLGCLGYLALCMYIMGDGYLSSVPDEEVDGVQRGILQKDDQGIGVHGQLISGSCLDILMKWDLYIEQQRLNVTGHGRPDRGYLTIGIPSVWRINGIEYLLQTLSSLVNATTDDDKFQITVLVFLADGETRFNEKTTEIISTQYQEHIAQGFIRIIQLSEALKSLFYPPLEGLKRNFGDMPTRVKWRAKQAVDYAFMFYFSRNLSKFYIQLEDDVVSSNNFLSAIKKFIKFQRERWYVVEFSELGFIGKLLHSGDLDRLARFLLTFYDQQPIDWLMPVFRTAMGQKDRILCIPTLFQHVGLKSSFDISHDNPLVDQYFEAQS